MTTYNTGNPVPSGAARDRFDNSQTFDQVINGPLQYYPNRIGLNVLSLAGMRAQYDAGQAQRQADFNTFLLNSGYETPVAYAPGLVITRPTQTVLYNGEIYRPKPASLPFTTTTFPADAAKWLANGDNSLRQELAAPTGAGKSGFNASLAYPAGSVGEALTALTQPGGRKQQRTFADFMMLQNLGNLDTLNKAIMARKATVVFLGDSIIEGDRDGLEDNSVALRIMALLRDQNPSVTWTFANFSLAGRGIAALSNSTYVGMAPPEDPNVGFYRPAGDQFNNAWPGGSVVGKPWLTHAQDVAPDIVFLMVGANDLSGDGNTNAAQVNGVLNTMNGWTKIPSVALAPAALPASTYGFQNEIQISANVMRGIARERALTLLDINRLFHLHRYAKDVDNLPYLGDDTFTGFPTNWTGATGAFTPAGSPGFALTGVGAAMRNTVSQDINIAATFTFADWSTQYGQLVYRSLGTIATQYTAQITGNVVQLYFGATQIASASISPAITNGSAVRLRVDVRGCLHRVFVNGLQFIRVYSYAQPMPGKHGFGIVGGSGTIQNLVVHYANPWQVGTPELSDVDIYGPGAFGGNGINHPTALANTVIWAEAFAPLLHHIRAARNVKIVDVIAPVAATSAENFAVASTAISMMIDGNAGFPGGVVVTPTGSFASCQLSRVIAVDNSVLTGRTIVVRCAASNGAFFLTTNVALPVGNWLVTATAMFSKDASNVVLNSLLVTAVRTG